MAAPARLRPIADADATGALTEDGDWRAEEDAWLERYVAEAERRERLTPEERRAEDFAAAPEMLRKMLAAAGLTGEELDEEVEVALAMYDWLELKMPHPPEEATPAERAERASKTIQRAHEAYEQATPEEIERIKQADAEFRDPEYRRRLFAAYAGGAFVPAPRPARDRSRARVPRSRRTRSPRDTRAGPSGSDDPSPSPSRLDEPAAGGRLGVCVRARAWSLSGEMQSATRTSARRRSSSPTSSPAG